MKVPFLPRSYKTGYYQVLEISIQLRFFKMVLQCLICIAFIILFQLVFTTCTFSAEKCVPSHVFLIGLCFYYLFVEAFLSITNIKNLNLCWKYFLQVFIYECWGPTHRFFKINMFKFVKISHYNIWVSRKSPLNSFQA